MNPNSYLTEIFIEKGLPKLFIDFDGTISKRDVIDRVLEEFADPRWLEIEAEWTSGKIGSRECLQKQFALVKVSPPELDEFLDTLELDAGFSALLKLCDDAEIPVHIISDGFDYYIRRLLAKNISDRNILSAVGISANRLIPHGKRLWRTEFPFFETVCSDGCATCKPAVMSVKNQYYAPSIFIGDGLSDRFAAKCADIVFAKGKLSEFCLKNRIPQTAFCNLQEVAESLDQAFENFVLTVNGRRRSWLEAA